MKYTLNPWVVRWEQSLQKALLSEKERKEYFIRFKVDGLLRGDYKSRMEGYAIGRQNGWLSANDIRSLEDLNPIEGDEGGDLYLINGSMTKLKDAGLFANKQAVNVSQSHGARSACALGSFSHTTCCPFGCAQGTCFTDRSVRGENDET